ncbi:MAG TPA: AAA family ATPase [Nocardioidaceae bacterium]|nr:AAA family ATPase [Nocardioidaceae bacterium]
MHLVVIFGPPAVGKMTVGHELTGLTGFRLFHNHMTVEPVLDIFPFGSPPFGRLVNEFRRRIIEEAADSDLPGLVFTYVWALEDARDKGLVASYVDIVESRGGRAHFVELAADQAVRLLRNTTDFRLERKRSKRDLEFSRSNLLELDANYVMNTGDGATVAEDLFDGRGYLRIDNTAVPAAEVAAEIVAAFDLPTQP